MVQQKINDASAHDSGGRRESGDKLLMTSESSPITLENPQAPPVKSQGLFKRNPPIVGEAEAIEAAKSGDPEAFSKLYALHKRRVYTLCLRMLGNVSEAEDMTQEAFLHLFRKIGSFRGESAFSTWLHRLTVNLVLMHLRKKGLNLVSLEETINPSEEDAPKRDFGSRDLHLTGSVDRVALERAVAALPPGYRMVFVLHDVEGFEHNEIATMLECSTGNSKSQLHKARLKLRELLRNPERSTEPTGINEVAV
jgi:RNA polymerase sigma-70 factor (ECF subfamily)